jgi:hypothetical protein
VPGTAIFHITKIHPRKIVTTVSEVCAGAYNKALFALQEEGNAFLLASRMCDKKRQISSPIPIEVASPRTRT